LASPTSSTTCAACSGWNASRPSPDPAPRIVRPSRQHQASTAKGQGQPHRSCRALALRLRKKIGRWRYPTADNAPFSRPRTELLIPIFGYKNHLGIDRRYGFIRGFTVTDAATHDGCQLGRLLDPDNTARPIWADTAYRSAANIALLARRGLLPQFQRAKPRGRPMPPHIARGNATRARVRVAAEHVFATQKCRLGLLIRTVGLARAMTKLGLANLVTNMRRLARLELRPQPT
jgi:transposase, IS5 family